MATNQARESYSRQTTSSPSPIARFAHERRYRRSADLVVRHLPHGGAFLDYGAGDGALLSRLARSRSDATLVGYEPFMESGLSKELPDGTGPYDVIGAFEVLEHLEAPQIDTFVKFCNANLNPGGKIIVSVPIMQGPILVPKYLNARLTKKPEWRYSLGELLRGTLLMGEVKRDPPGLHGLFHKGFVWKELRRKLDASFRREQERLSPFPTLWWGVNSQWFGVFSLSRDRPKASRCSPASDASSAPPGHSAARSAACRRP